MGRDKRGWEGNIGVEDRNMGDDFADWVRHHRDVG